ncbi:MAG: hypothetical protein JSW11_07145 [Candidatus Heimdallarchaeota archaeon]|nr:MAG: hypothetical protein JSW11_07145 [Candidatus Heimdallarchaeota archaeon]
MSFLVKETLNGRLDNTNIDNKNLILLKKETQHYLIIPIKNNSLFLF